MPDNFRRLLPWLIISIFLAILAQFLQSTSPGNVLAVSVYKAHLLSLGGWVGYWLDRALFPYDRPHTYLLEDAPSEPEPCEVDGMASATLCSVAGSNFGFAMLRRAIVVAAALICVGLGA